MSVFESIDFDHHETVAFFDDKVSGLKSIIAIHSAALARPGLPATTASGYPRERRRPGKQELLALALSKPRSTDALFGLSVFKQVSALIGAVDDCTW